MITGKTTVSLAFQGELKSTEDLQSSVKAKGIDAVGFC